MAAVLEAVVSVVLVGLFVLGLVRLRAWVLPAGLRSPRALRFTRWDRRVLLVAEAVALTLLPWIQMSAGVGLAVLILALFPGETRSAVGAAATIVVMGAFAVGLHVLVRRRAPALRRRRALLERYSDAFGAWRFVHLPLIAIQLCGAGLLGALVLGATRLTAGQPWWTFVLPALLLGYCATASVFAVIQLREEIHAPHTVVRVGAADAS